jgi:hypothetical protein
MFNVFNILKKGVELPTLKSMIFILFFVDVQWFQHFEKRSWITNTKINDFFKFLNFLLWMFNVFNILKKGVELPTLKSMIFILFFVDVQWFQHFEKRSWITNIKINDFFKFLNFLLWMFNVFNILKKGVEWLTLKSMIFFKKICGCSMFSTFWKKELNY